MIFFFVTYPPTQLNVSHNITFLFEKKGLTKKAKETIEEKEKDVVVVNSICGESNW